MLFVDDVVVVDKSQEGANWKLELSGESRIQRF
jgi:hypothetical protein